MSNDPPPASAIARIIICGGRTYADRARVAAVLDQYAAAKPTIVHGGAPGADTLADREARARGLRVEIFPAQWDVHGRAAGPIRNQEMVRAGGDLVIAFAGGRGTADCLRRAKRAGIPTRTEP